MQDDNQIHTGFADPVFQSQSAFRALLAALSEPGLACDLGDASVPPAGLEAATAIALLTLADYETPIWLPAALRDGPAGAWLRFHCGAALVDDPARAAFAVIDGAATEPKLSAFNAGDDQFPDRSTTVLVQCAGFEGGEAVTLEGPGIPGRRSIAPTGLRPGFWAEVEDNAAVYPLGVDLLLVQGAQVLGLPRSTQIVETR
ncbi:phosphonate C-P lyase system protein PhnH [Bosea sp. (in: a-proteobacteria)]|jgi:alpha-D-ribose 1-methylphosphonate 5-triphosphate synthase subunit PhnH|uniref:phosphonate C-P lyase system protein PhnH n=1 Tax=Bosea sp. (in: a-proteobacteria) TaxID=1871050 RepID=UPI002DDD0C80|nr:phosphonate C-P lyase system protein PhnH [Bosea sp. (in: a-proteobacteria)]HEV2508532.1 phosphonate C-P lyase system protein PhnH [Bosea sp. (in: a-proteobacteria)]